MLDFRFLFGSTLAGAVLLICAFWIVGAQDRVGGLANRPSVQTAAPPAPSLPPQVSGPVIVEMPDRPPLEMPPEIVSAAQAEPEFTGSIALAPPLPEPRPAQAGEAEETKQRPRRSRPRVVQAPKEPEILNPFRLFFPGVGKDREKR